MNITAAKNATASVFIQNTGSLSAQIGSGVIQFNTNTNHSGTTTSGVNTANASYILIDLQNSVSSDTCFIDSASAIAIP
jgi:hypothetical protein